MANQITISRSWSMPNSRTFCIPPIKRLIEKYMPVGESTIVDPFSNTSCIANLTNDLDLSMPSMYHMDATDFLKTIDDQSVDMVLYDPPYSPRQVSESYKKFNRSVNMTTTQASYWAMQKREIARIVKPGGTVITFGWNSGGIGKKLGFEIIEILLVAHGGWHNDTICTVEQKLASTL